MSLRHHYLVFALGLLILSSLAISCKRSSTPGGRAGGESAAALESAATGGGAVPAESAETPSGAMDVAEGAATRAAGPRAAGTSSAIVRDRSGDKLDAMAIIAELSGDSYEGRQAGSTGGARAGAWIAGQLASIGMPAKVIEFPERVPVLVREARLSAAIPGGEKREFSIRRDFREVARGGWAGVQAEGPLAVVEGPDTPFKKGSIVVMNGEDYDNANDELFRAKGAVGILLGLGSSLVEKRPTYAGQAPDTLVNPRPDFIKMAVSPETFTWLFRAAGRGGRATLVNPQDFVDVTCRDYLASWNGDGGGFDPAFLLVAHYDHVGKDLGDSVIHDDEVFPGAFDNASGAAFLLSLAENFARDGVRADIAFLFTDAEEVNLSGSVAFLKAAPFPLRSLPALNFDMVGGTANLPLSLYTGDDQGSLALAGELGAALEKAGIATRSEHPVLNVDSGPLSMAGASAVTLCEYDDGIYHTVRDHKEGISAPELAALEEAVYSFILGKLGY